MKINHFAIDDRKCGKFSRHLYLDVEPCPGEGYALVVRGEDRVMAVNMTKSRDPDLIWNEIDGAAEVHRVAYHRYEKPLLAMRDHLYNFYTGTKSFGVRFDLFAANAGADGVEILAILLAFFPANNFQDGNKSRSRCASYSTRRADKSKVTTE